MTTFRHKKNKNNFQGKEWNKFEFSLHLNKFFNRNVETIFGLSYYHYMRLLEKWASTNN